MIQTLFLSLFALGIGIVLLLWGYRAFLVLLPIFGFFAGLWLGAHAISLIFGNGFFAGVTGLVVGLVAGVIFALLSYLFYAAAIGLIAAAIGYGLGAGFMQAIGVDATLLVVLAGVAVAVIVALLVYVFNIQKYVVIALTALAGANAIVLAPLLLFGRVSADQVQGAGNAISPVLQDSWLWLAVWIAIAIAGIVYQIRSNRAYVFTVDDYESGWGTPG
ncbi:MAG: DUF4203 domain-containing protein [Chloroflexota bacterium]|nr:DUF4203 domain-containing protein [Chloroflexota bacterium]